MRQPVHIVNSAGQFLNQWRTAQGSFYVSSSLEPDFVDGDVVWSKPLPGMLKLNVDAVLFSDEGATGLGWILRDSHGCFLKACSIHLFGLLNSGEAEAVSIREALSWLRQQALDNVLLETDAKQVVDLIRKPDSSSALGLVVDDCISLLKHFGNVSVRFVRRSANEAAHRCARAAHYMSGSREWSSTPLFLHSVLSVD